MEKKRVLFMSKDLFIFEVRDMDETWAMPKVILNLGYSVEYIIANWGDSPIPVSIMCCKPRKIPLTYL